ncbi:MAG: dTDP-4-dehydrorhamnose 3,5-epimerase family protein [Solirubrobacteraceae bacterium]
MGIAATRIEGVRIVHPQVHGDERGRLVEIFRATGYPEQFVQANHGRSRAGVLRGLHYHQHQADLWYAISGRAQVALADLRGGGGTPPVETFVLDAAEPTAVYIPRGVAHGYLALTDLDLVYLVTHEYDPQDEHGVSWDDPTLAIPWQLEGGQPVVSERDRGNPTLQWERIPSFS